MLREAFSFILGFLTPLLSSYLYITIPLALITLFKGSEDSILAYIIGLTTGYSAALFMIPRMVIQ